MQSAGYSCLILIKLENFQQFCEKFLNIKFHEDPSSWEPSCSKRTHVTKLIDALGCFSKAKKKAAIISLYSFNRLVFLLETVHSHYLNRHYVI